MWHTVARWAEVRGQEADDDVAAPHRESQPTPPKEADFLKPGCCSPSIQRRRPEPNRCRRLCRGPGRWTEGVERDGAP
jgi:hypothetical protein